MNRKNTVKLLSIFCASQIFFLIIISIYNPSQKAAKAEQRVLLNPKYADINGFSIDSASSGEKMIFVHRADGIWLCIYEYKPQRQRMHENDSFSNTNSDIPDMSATRVVFPAQKEKCLSFLEILRKKQIMYTILDSVNEWDPYHLVDNKCVSVQFFNIQSNFLDNIINFQYFLPENIYEEIYFGKINNTKTGIAVRSSKKTAAYLYPAEIIPYLTTQISFWCDRLLIPDCAHSILSPNDISAVTVILYDDNTADITGKVAGKEYILVSESSVQKAADCIFSLGSTKFYPISFLQTFSQYTLVFRCELKTDSLPKQISISVFQTGDGRYFVYSDIYDFSVLYIQEISEFTYLRLKEIL